MKKSLIQSAAAMALAIAAAALSSCDRPVSVVILHTNDTHSQIDPDRQKGTGGVLRRKVLIDSVRRVEPNVLVVDAGDAVQGTLYYTLFGGEVEQAMLNRLGYDVQILGNHEFDNGLEQLAECYARATPAIVSTNYGFEGTPLDTLVVPYVIKKSGGKRIAFLGANINPDGLIAPAKYEGMTYSDVVGAINRAAVDLRRQGADAVVVLSHIGYYHDPGELGFCDPDLARLCPEVDLVIGGHSHTDLTPTDERTRIARAPGDTVVVVQNGKGGHWLGKVTLDFNSRDKRPQARWERIAVDSRLDSRISDDDQAFLAHYRARVDSVYNVPMVTATADFNHQAMMNTAADVVRRVGARLTGGKIDMALMNKGGIRHDFDAGVQSRGDIIDVFPFDNRVVVVDIPGSSLADLFNLLGRQGGQGVSSNVRATIAADGWGCSSVTIDGQPIDPDRTYRIATIDYLAGGGDSMSQLKDCPVVAQSPVVLYDDIIGDLTQSDTISPDPTPRMK